MQYLRIVEGSLAPGYLRCEPPGAIVMGTITSNIWIQMANGNDIESCEKGGSLWIHTLGLIRDNVGAKPSDPKNYLWHKLTLVNTSVYIQNLDSVYKLRAQFQIV